MIGVRLNELLRERGHTLYWLAKETGIRYATIWNLSKGNVGRLSMDVLDRVCGVLRCQPGDLLVRESGVKTKRKAKV